MKSLKNSFGNDILLWLETSRMDDGSLRERIGRFVLNGVGRGEENENKNKGALLTRETVGMTLLLFSAVIFLITVTGEVIFGDIGRSITAFFVGAAGYFVYPLLVLAMYGSAVLAFGKKFIPARWLVRVFLLAAAAFLIVHTATSAEYFGSGYGDYLRACWHSAETDLADGTGGGVLFGIIVYPVRAVLSTVGAYIFFSLLTALALWFILISTPLRSYLLPSARMRRQEKRAPAQKQPMRFDDLPEPEHVAMPEEQAGAPVYGYDAPAAPGYQQPQQGYPSQPAYQPEQGYQQSQQGYPSQPAYQPEPSYQQPAAYQPEPDVLQLRRADGRPYTPPKQEKAEKADIFADLPSDPHERSRAILFRNGDPATSYKENLIFDRDSRFNTYPRRSSVGYQETAQPASSAQTSAPSSPYSAPASPYASARQSGTSYAEQYAADRSRTRPSMPRQATPVRPEPVTPEEDLNYPQTPSYRASAQSPAEEPDYYAHDVPFGGLSSQPTVDDFDMPPAAQAEPERPAERPSYEAPVRPAAQAEPERPVERSGYEAPVRPAAPSRAESEAREVTSFLRPSVERTSDFEEPVRPVERTSDFEEPVRPVERTIERPVEPEPRFRTQDEALDPDSRVYSSPVRDSAAELFDDDTSDEEFAQTPEEAPVPIRRERGERSARAVRGAEATPIPDEEAPAPKKHIYKPYVYPNINILQDPENAVSVSQAEIDQNSAVIIDTLAGFHVDAEIVRVTTGAAVTRYDIDIPRNIAVAQVIKRDAEIAMRLHTRDGVNIYSNSEAGAISIEVPNSVRATVGLKSVMLSPEFSNSKPGSLMFALGQDVEGRNVCEDIVKMTHILVAGATNTGKSVCLNSMLISLICKYSPEDLRLILIDPKKTEFIIFDGLPHLMINEIITDAQKAIAAFNWAIKEMERRYDLFEKKTRGGTNVRDIDGYNRSLTEDEEKLPRVVIVVDELADLMSVAKKDLEERIQRLTQKARAAGIHLVLATQRPSVDVITGVIKGNLPTRIALRTVSDVDSRTILDESGAQKLLGKGDMLYRTSGMFNCRRVQGAYVSDREMQDIIAEIKANNEAYFDSSVADFINNAQTDEEGGSVSADDSAVDPQYIKALGIAVNLGQASISLIQRKCSVGYNHAGKIIEWMEDMGYITPFDGKAKARGVLLSKEDFEAKYGDFN